MSEAEQQGRHGSLTVAGQAGERLDRVLQEALPALSRTAVQRLIASGGVLVNGRAGRAGQRLQPAERVEWELPEPGPPAEDPRAEEIPLDVVYEDDDLLVIRKPKGLVVHPAPGHRSGTLVNALLGRVGDELAEGGGPERPGIVHRLDRDTSGLMVVAKSERAYRSLQAQIAARTADRRYAAVVLGAPRFERAAVDAPIGRHPTNRKKMAVIRPGGAAPCREARTELRVLERLPPFALLEARLETGRTHQVRVHCAHIGLPVAGDPVYGRRPPESQRLPGPVRAALDALEGQALHAYRLAFDHPVTGARLRFLYPPAGDVRRLLDALESRWEPADESD